MTEITKYLDGLNGKDQANKILPVIYKELRGLAAAQLAKEERKLTLQATSLVHEAYMRLVENENYDWKNRAHFFGAAATAMRRILIDQARKRKTQRQGGGLNNVTLLGSDAIELSLDEQVLELDDALNKLAETDAIAAQLVQLRVFAGVSAVEAAQTLGIPERTARRTWDYAKAWLRREMTSNESNN